ncbi:MAG: efflux RND transporter periplasmic adaptor subunit [Sedimentisphaerales bacterium]|nr:efflux RND transporter periplasmic adaptor subunit [Sedimentisphaerales bacterium]
MRTVWIILITILVTLGLAAAGWYILRARGKLSQEQPTVVRIEKPLSGELIEFINAPGEIEPKRKVEISAKVSARIVEMPYEEGDRVTKGDPNANPPRPASLLLRLDASDLEAALRGAEARRAAQAAQIDVAKVEIESKRASIEGIRAQQLQAQRELDRTNALLQSRDVPQSDVDQQQSLVDDLDARLKSSVHDLQAAELQLPVLQYNLEAADAEISRARDMLSYTVITSPIDGVITRINAEVGEMVITGTMNNPGTVILVVADLSRMLLLARVDEVDIGAVRPGQKAKVHIHAWPDKVFQGTVQTIALTRSTDLRESSNYFETEILLENEGRQILSGMNADVDIEIKKHVDVLKVPSQAVLGRPVDELPIDIRDTCPEVDKKKAFATVVYRFRDGEAIVTPVTIGAGDTTHTIILSGLSPDDSVIVGPYKVLENLKHKQKVKDERQDGKDQSASAIAGPNTP